MAQISRLSRLVNGIQRGVDLASNTLVVQDIQVGGLAGTVLTKVILDNLVNLQNGTDFATGTNSHTHDGRYYQKSELNSTSVTSGASLIGINDAGSIITATTVEGALQEIKTEENSLRTLSGTSVGANDLGTFSSGIIPAARTIKQALQSLETSLSNTQSTIQNFEWQPSVKDRSITPPGSPASGDRYLIDSSLGTPTGAWAGQGNKIAEWNGSAWVFTTPTTGTYVSVDTEGDGLYLFGGSSWAKKYFESTTASTGLTKVGFDVRIADTNSGGVQISSGAFSLVVDNSTVEVNAGTLRVKDLGITTAKLALNAVDDTILRLRNNQYARARNAANSANVNVYKVNASDVIEFASLPQAPGTPSAANDLINKAYFDAGSGNLQRTVTVGEAMVANTTFLVRWAVNGETAGRVYKADNDATSSDKFHVVGVVTVGGTALNAGDTATLKMMGSQTLGSSDTPFAGTDIGKPVFLGVSGAYTTTAPSSSSLAVVIVGYVETTTKLDVKSKEIVGVN